MSVSFSRDQENNRAVMSSVWSEPSVPRVIDTGSGGQKMTAIDSAKQAYGVAPYCTVFVITSLACFSVFAFVRPRIVRCPKTGRSSCGRMLFWALFFALVACCTPSVFDAVILNRA